MEKLKHGGRRPGAGRPKGERTIPITVRVPEAEAEALRFLIRKAIWEFRQAKEYRPAPEYRPQ